MSLCWMHDERCGASAKLAGARNSRGENGEFGLGFFGFFWLDAELRVVENGGPKDSWEACK